MNGAFPAKKTCIAVFLTVLLVWGCGNDSDKAEAKTPAKTPAPIQQEKTKHHTITYHRVKTNYKGRTIYIYDRNDLPLTGVPLITIKQRANSGEYELGRRLGKGYGVTRDIPDDITWIQKAVRHNIPASIRRMFFQSLPCDPPPMGIFTKSFCLCPSTIC
jgi:hypothetical protein